MLKTIRELKDLGIDVFFEEDDGIVLLDYKTDRVDEDSQLVLRYEKQLQLYKEAIEKAYNINS